MTVVAQTSYFVGASYFDRKPMNDDGVEDDIQYLNP